MKRNFCKDRLIFLDLELTMDDQAQNQEIVQIGLVETDLHVNVLRKDSFYTAPNKAKHTSALYDLTGIEQRHLNKARPFKEVIRTINKKYGLKNKTVIAWGNDGIEINRAIAENAVSDISIERFINIAEIYRILTVTKKSVGLWSTIKSMGITDLCDQKEHDALSDAFNTAQVYKAMMSMLA